MTGVQTCALPISVALFQVTRSCWCSTGRPGGAHEFNLGFLGLGTEIDVLFLNGMVWFSLLGEEEKNRNLSSSMKALRNKEQRNNNNKSTSPNKAQQDYSFRTGAVAAA